MTCVLVPPGYLLLLVLECWLASRFIVVEFVFAGERVLHTVVSVKLLCYNFHLFAH